MDVAGYVDYEVEVPVDIRFPDTREKTGIVWWVKHPECAAAEALAAAHAREVTLEQIAASTGNVDKSGAAARREREKVAACVSRWDWGDMTFENGKVPKCDFDGVMTVLERAKWFYSDPYQAINDLANFTKDGKNNSGKPSESKSGTKAKTGRAKPGAKETRE